MKRNIPTISRNHLEGIRARSQSLNIQSGREKSELEDRFKKHIRDESHRMTRNWSNSIEQQTKRRSEERTKDQQTRTAEEEKTYQEMRETQKRAQRLQIENIESSVRRSQPGPKLLDSAALLSNCLHVQRHQREEMALRNISNRQQHLHEGHLFRQQNLQWQRHDQVRRQEEYVRARHYQQDLQQLIEEKRFRVQTAYQQQQLMAVAQREVDEASRRALERESREMERRRAQMRKAATDAMLLAEQRRLRDRMEDKVQDTLCQIHLEGKERQQELIKRQTKAMQSEQAMRQSMAKEKVAQALQESEKEVQETEQRVLVNAATEYREKMLDKDREEAEKKKRLKAERIQFHLDEMKAEKQRKSEKDKQLVDSLSNRLTNDQVSFQFEAGQREKYTKEARELRLKLTSQWREKEAMEKAIKEGVQCFSNRHCDFSRDHKDFVNYATEALQGAKGLPVQPFVKAINAYARENFVEEKPELPHLRVLQPPVYYDRPALPRNNDKATIRYNIEQLRALNPICREMMGNG